MNKKLERISDINTEFDKWYTDVVKQAELMDYGEVKGTMIIKPYAWKIWELLQEEMNKRFKKEDVENISMPLFIPKSLIDKEKDHVDGFAPEILTVTKAGNSTIEEPFYIRPTSEALFMNQFKKEVNTYKNLPIIWNQWCSVVRWEKKTRPFLRSTEFHWQEGHTVHSTPQEAKELTITILRHYEEFAKEFLAIPMFTGRKSELEKFAGAQETYTIEAMMKNGKALQSATSHYFGDNFTKVYDIKFQNKDNKVEYAYTSSWGISTRIIGAIIMAHGDEKGLVLPPKIAPIQVILLPLIHKNSTEVLEKANEIKELLSDYRVSIDASDKGLGFKSADAEIKGIPIRIELGSRDLANNEITLVKRNDRTKIQFNLDGDLKEEIFTLLETIQKEMLQKATKIKEEKTKRVKTFKELAAQVKKGYALAPWCKEDKCEEEIKDETLATTRCIPIDLYSSTNEPCVKCGQEAKVLTYFSLAY